MTDVIYSERAAFIDVLPPAADRYNTDPATDIVSLHDYRKAVFILSEGAGGTGTVAITAEACSDVSATETTEIPFYYRTTSAGVMGTLTRASAATGYTTTAGANKTIVIEVDNADLPVDQPFVRLQLTEVANDPCVAGVSCALMAPRYQRDVLKNPLS